MRKLNSQVITTFVSEAGLDGQNGTYYGFVEMDRYYCMAVAQGYDADGGLTAPSWRWTRLWRHLSRIRAWEQEGSGGV